jgi:adenosine deaminase
VWGAIRALDAERIGHGVRAIEDPALVAYLAEHRIPLEVNPTSNIRLGVYRGYDEHPLLRLYEAGVPLTVNSDDGPLFNTTLTNEVLLLASQFGLDLPRIDELLLNGVRHSFLPPERKAAMERNHRAQLDALKREHGLA